MMKYSVLLQLSLCFTKKETGIGRGRDLPKVIHLLALPGFELGPRLSFLPWAEPAKRPLFFLPWRSGI